MENAVDALKIAFAVLVFVLAITITFSFISQAKTTSDAVLYYADDTNFYEYANSSKKNRTVDIEEVISSLNRYYKESISVTVKLKNNATTFDLTASNVSMNELENNLKNYIENNLLTLDKNSTFKEEFVEVPISGIYVTGEDNTEVVKAAGGKKLYVTYTLQ